MRKLRNTSVHREPAGFRYRSLLGGTRYVKGSHMQHVMVDSTYRPQDDEGHITLIDTITAGRGVSKVSIHIGHKDFGVLIDKMMQGHPEATIRAIGAALAEFGQTKEKAH